MGAKDVAMNSADFSARSSSLAKWLFPGQEGGGVAQPRDVDPGPPGGEAGLGVRAKRIQATTEGAEPRK